MVKRGKCSICYHVENSSNEIYGLAKTDKIVRIALNTVKDRIFVSKLCEKPFGGKEDVTGISDSK